jgi:hypothetical protein
MVNLFEMIVESNSSLRKDGGIVGSLWTQTKKRPLDSWGGGGALCVYFSHVMCINKGIIWGYLCKGLLKFPTFKLSIFKTS